LNILYNEYIKTCIFECMWTVYIKISIYLYKFCLILNFFICKFFLVTNFLRNNERLKPSESHSKSWLWQHSQVMLKSRSRLRPLFVYFIIILLFQYWMVFEWSHQREANLETSHLIRFVRTSDSLSLFMICYVLCFIKKRIFF